MILMKIKIYLLTLLLLPALNLLAQKESTVTRGQLLVKFKPQVVPENFMVGFQTYARDGGGIWLEKKLSKSANINLIGYDTLTVNPLNLLQEIKKDPQVEYACFDISVEPRGDMPDDPKLESQWGLFTIGAEKVWEIIMLLSINAKKLHESASGLLITAKKWKENEDQILTDRPPIPP